MELRTITSDDLSLWERMQCDPVMMAELGGPHPKERIPQIFQNTLGFVESGRGWVFKVIPDEDPQGAAGSVCIWESSWNGENINEIGWMILPAFQGQGLGSKAVRSISSARSRLRPKLPPGSRGDSAAKRANERHPPASLCRRSPNALGQT